MPPTKFGNALKVVEDFLRAIKDVDTNASVEDTGTPEVMFWRRDEGVVSLRGETARQYRQCIDALETAVAHEKLISRKAIEKALQTAILAVLDRRRLRRGTKFGRRLNDARQELEQSLAGPLQRFQAYKRVVGLSPEGLPLTVGQVEFVVFDEAQADKFRQHDKPGAEIANSEGWRSLDGQTTAIIEVIAIEPRAARALASRELRRTLDIINFFTALWSPKQYLTLVGEGESAVETTFMLVFGEKPGTNMDLSTVGPLGRLDLRPYMDESDRNAGLRLASQWLREGNQAELPKALLTAMELAGRAAVNWREEDAFLLYAIALESLILGNESTTNVTPRLRLKVSQLLGGSLEELGKMVGRLYGIRSRIAHDGVYPMTDADLGLIRAITYRSIGRLLLDEPFCRMVTYEELNNWFDQQLQGVMGDEPATSGDKSGG